MNEFRGTALLAPYIWKRLRGSSTHRPCIDNATRKQVERIVKAFDRLGSQFGEPFDDLDSIFGLTADS
jgi:hypothetical protein